MTGFIHGEIAKIITGPRMANVWVQVNRVAPGARRRPVRPGHSNGAITVSNGQVTIGLAPFIDIAKQDLAARGLTLVNKLPTFNPRSRCSRPRTW